MMDNLTEKQRRFVEAYCGPAMGNATEAARLAGYKGSDNTLRSMGAENMAKPAIASAIAEIAQEVRGHAFLDAEVRQDWLARVAAGEEMDIYPSKVGPVEGPPDLRTRMAANDQLNRMQASYLERRQHEHTGVQRVIFKVPDNGRGPEPDPD